VSGLSKVHLIGAGGVGMSALALMLRDLGCAVSGSDISASYLTELLEKAGVKLFWGQKAGQGSDAHLAVYSSDIPPEQAELLFLQKRGIPCIHRSEMLARLMKRKRALQITGTHGKTTTTAMLAHLLVEAGKDPSYAIGGLPPSLGRHGHLGGGDYFIAEADESDGSFLRAPSLGAIFTNLEPEHLSFWGSFERLKEAARAFCAATKQWLVWCGDDPVLREFTLSGISYGRAGHCHYRLGDVESSSQGIRFTIEDPSGASHQLAMPLFGQHNALNATGVFALAVQLGLTPEEICQGLATFRGVKRRMEQKGSCRGALIYDDYGHHPTEMRVTVEALRAILAPGERLVVAWQPHRYSRTNHLWDQFQGSLDAADLVFLTDIYPAGEAPIPGVEAGKLPLSLREDLVRYTPRHQLTEAVAAALRPGDLLLTMGAGDITHLGPDLLASYGTA